MPDKRLVNGQCSKVLSDELFSSALLDSGRYRGMLTGVVHKSADRAAAGWAEPLCEKLLKRLHEAKHGAKGFAEGWTRQEWFTRKEGRER